MFYKEKRHHKHIDTLQCIYMFVKRVFLQAKHIYKTKSRAVAKQRKCLQLPVPESAHIDYEFMPSKTNCSYRCNCCSCRMPHFYSSRFSMKKKRAIAAFALFLIPMQCLAQNAAPQYYSNSSKRFSGCAIAFSREIFRNWTISEKKICLN